MNEYNIEKTIKELEDQIEENNHEILVNDEKTRMAKANRFESKVETTVAFSLLPYLGLATTSAVLIANGTMTNVVGSIPPESIPLIILGGSLGIGTIARKLLEKKYKIEERLRAFTNAKTDKEKLEEELRHEIEIEKIENRNRTLEEAKETIKANQAMINSLSSRYNISDKNMPLTKEELEYKVEELTNVLKQKYEELDILTTQIALYRKFSKVKSKADRVMDTAMNAMMGGMITMMYVDMPIILMKDIIHYDNPNTAFISILAPFFAGIGGISAYTINKNKNISKTYNKLNNELENNSLPKDQEAIDTISLAAKIDNLIKEISLLLIQLYEQKRILERLNNNYVEDNKQEEIQPSVLLRKTLEQ